MAKYYIDLISKHPIVSLEDPFAEDEWETWPTYSHKSKVRFKSLGTNVEYLLKAINMKAADTLLLKVNQIGILTESIQATKECYDAKWLLTDLKLNILLLLTCRLVCDLVKTILVLHVDPNDWPG